MSPKAKKFKSSEPYLESILIYVEKIKSHISTINKKEDFTADSIVYDAVSMMYLQIGETITKLEQLPEQIVNKFPEALPWHDLKGLRNLMAHDYAKIDPGMIWDFTQNDLNKVSLGVMQILKQRFGKE